MNITKLNKEHFEAFKAYMIKHRFEHDESYLYPEDIDEFEIGEDNPTYLLMENGQIIGCLSMMLTDYFRRGNKSRIRIFHCESTDFDHYQMLWNAIEPLGEGIKKVELFIPDKLQDTLKILNDLNFNYYRTSFVMVRKDKPKVSYTLPEGYSLRPYKNHDEDAMHYAEIRNAAFMNLKGSEVPLNKEQVIKLAEEPYLLKDGIQFLYHDKKPVGLIRMTEEEDESGRYAFVGPIALLPDYQGKGLGTLLLKAGILLGEENGYPDTMLSVNGENRGALGLYLKSDFEVDMALSCLQISL